MEVERCPKCGTESYDARDAKEHNREGGEVHTIEIICDDCLREERGEVEFAALDELDNPTDAEIEASK